MKNRNKMKHFFTAFLLLILCTTAKATECVDRIYTEGKINLYLCQNHSGFNETRGLLYNARAKVLNDYIKDKINKKELKDKNFEIKIYDESLTSPQLILKEEDKSYFVTITGYPSLQRLLSIVDYFSKPDWVPFLAFDYNKESIENIQKRIDDFFKQNTKYESFAYKPFSIWEKDGVSLQYSGDSLRYLINNQSLSFQAVSNLPVRIQNRYLFFHEEHIFVVQDMQTIKSIAIDTSWKDTSEDFDIYVFPKWVNICWGGEENWIYSYSYDENKFYKRKR